MEARGKGVTAISQATSLLKPAWEKTRKLGASHLLFLLRDFIALMVRRAEGRFVFHNCFKAALGMWTLSTGGVKSSCHPLQGYVGFWLLLWGMLGAQLYHHQLKVEFI